VIISVKSLALNGFGHNLGLPHRGKSATDHVEKTWGRLGRLSLVLRREQRRMWQYYCHLEVRLEKMAVMRRSMEGERITARLACDLWKLGLKARIMWDQNPCWLVYKGATVHYLVYCLLMTHVREPRSTVQYKRLTQGFESLLMRILLAKHGEINHQIWWWILQLWWVLLGVLEVWACKMPKHLLYCDWWWDFVKTSVKLQRSQSPRVRRSVA